MHYPVKRVISGSREGVQLQRGSSRREQRLLWVEGEGTASRREQQEETEVTAGGGRLRSFKERAEVTVGRGRGCSFKFGAAGGSRGHCRLRGVAASCLEQQEGAEVTVGR